ncbi:PP2C family protein-serine/threonine phosphatase [Planctomycetota bacterium]
MELKIQSGDRLILLTDGIAETYSPNGELFGRKRLLEIFEHGASDPLEVLSARLIDSIVSFRGSEAQLDDITMLAVEL